VFGIGVFIVHRGVEGSEPGGQDDGAYLELHLLIYLGVVYGPGGAEIGADFTITSKKVGTFCSVNGWYVGHCLGIGDINGLSSPQALIVLREYWPHLFVGDFSKLDVAGGADKVAGTTSYTCFREGIEGCCYLHVRTTAGKVNSPGTYPLAHADAEATKNAIIIVQLESRFLDPELRSQIFDKVVVRAASQKEFDYHLPVADNFFGIGLDLHARPNRIIAGGDISFSPPIKQLHCTESAQPGWLEGFVVTEGGYMDIVLLCNLEDC